MEQKPKFHWEFEDIKPTLRKVDLFGSPGTNKTKWDNREDCHPVGNFLPQMRIDTISMWFKRPDKEAVSLEGFGTSFKKLNEDCFFEVQDSVNEERKEKDLEYDIANFDDGEYIKQINVLVAAASNAIGALEFITTKPISKNDPTNRKILFCGLNTEEFKNPDPPKGEWKRFDLLNVKDGKKDDFPGYAVGFYGEYDADAVTYLGVYVAPITELNYYIRRPYLLIFKKLQQDPNMVAKIAEHMKLKITKGKFEHADLEEENGNSSKILLYFLHNSMNHPELFKEVLNYL